MGFNQTIWACRDNIKATLCALWLAAIEPNSLGHVAQRIE